MAEYKMKQLLWKPVWEYFVCLFSSIKLHIDTQQPNNSTSKYYPRQMKMHPIGELFMNGHCVFIYSPQRKII